MEGCGTSAEWHDIEQEMSLNYTYSIVYNYYSAFVSHLRTALGEYLLLPWSPEKVTNVLRLAR